MPCHTLQARNYIAACFTVSLIRDETIQGHKIRYTTIRNYVSAAISLHVDRRLPSPHQAGINYITIVLKAVQQFEKQPNPRDMAHAKMVYHTQASRSHNTVNSVEDALADWVYLGHFVGFRGIEWCQTTHHRYLEIDHPNWLGLKSYAFVAEDLKFFTNAKQQVNTLTPTSVITIVYVIMRFCKQKNDRNYEVIPYYRDETNLTFCPIVAAIQIRLCSIRLHLKPDEPLGVFCYRRGKHSGLRCYITNQHIAMYLQSIAMPVFHLKPNNKILNCWTSHSICVITACNLLH